MEPLSPRRPRPVKELLEDVWEQMNSHSCFFWLESLPSLFLFVTTGLVFTSIRSLSNVSFIYTAWDSGTVSSFDVLLGICIPFHISFLKSVFFVVAILTSRGDRGRVLLISLVSGDMLDKSPAKDLIGVLSVLWGVETLF